MLEVIRGGNPDRFVKQYDAGRTWCTNSKMRMGIL